MSLKDELPDIMHYLDLDSEEQMNQFQDAMQEVMKFTQIIQDKLQNGSDEDKEEVQEVLEDVKGKISKQMESLYEDLGITEDEVQNFVSNPDNFKPQDWNAMAEMQNSLDKVKKTSSKKINKQKTDWIRS
ncbi:MAG TPA: hypothetical protein P5048_00065 [Chlamydiales bacterium]|nr:hypothetical protein [Chlamydiales bacterium]